MCLYRSGLNPTFTLKSCNKNVTLIYRELGLENVKIIVADISTFEMEGSYDRIFSIGMFEHMKNYKDLLKKISKWMKTDGFLFVEYFCHKTYAYHFEVCILNLLYEIISYIFHL
ncbi:putative (S)-coclaurine-N-methyltransferase [Helianthus anomalus]